MVRGIDNRVEDPEIWPMLEVEIERAAASIGEQEISQLPAVAPWRAAFAQFGVKPSKYRSSIEAMLRSAQSGRLRSINPLVDLYNTISLRHQLPVGGEDLAKIVGDIRLTRATGRRAVYSRWERSDRRHRHRERSSTGMTIPSSVPAGTGAKPSGRC